MSTSDDFKLKCKNMMIGENKLDLASMREEMAHDGYTPVQTLMEMTAANWNYQDMVTAVLYGLLRGNYNGKKRDEPKAKRMMDPLVKKGLQESKSENDKGITISRISSAVPWLPCLMTTGHTDLANDHGLPTFLRCSVGATFCKNEQEIKAWKLWYAEVLKSKKMINENEASINKKIEDGMKVADIQYSKKYLGQDLTNEIRAKIEELVQTDSINDRVHGFDNSELTMKVIDSFNFK